MSRLICSHLRSQFGKTSTINPLSKLLRDPLTKHDNDLDIPTQFPGTLYLHDLPTYTKKETPHIKHTLYMGEISPISRKRFVTV